MCERVISLKENLNETWGVVDVLLLDLDHTAIVVVVVKAIWIESLPPREAVDNVINSGLPGYWRSWERLQSGETCSFLVFVIFVVCNVATVILGEEATLPPPNNNVIEIGGELYVYLVPPLYIEPGTDVAVYVQ